MIKHYSIIESVRKEGLRRGMSPRTIKSYQHCLNKFFRYYHYKDFRKISRIDVEKYLDSLVDRGRAGSTINVYLMALKFLYEQVLRKKLTVNVKTSKIPKRLPEFLTQNETRRLLAVIKNPKHKLMVSLLYASGMRVGELIKLKVKDLEFEQNYGWVRQGKGAKDRPFVIAKSLKQDLLNWIKTNELSYGSYLFTGYTNLNYSRQSVRMIIKKARMNAKIDKNVHPHTLRHSFATHFIQNGYHAIELQPLLGHNSINTTMKYVHMASPNLFNVESPFDKL